MSEFVKDNNIIDGKKIATEIEKELIERIKVIQTKYKVKPGLAVILVGGRNDSEVYVRMKRLKAENLGFNFNLIKYETRLVFPV